MIPLGPEGLILVSSELQAAAGGEFDFHDALFTEVAFPEGGDPKL